MYVEEIKTKSSSGKVHSCFLLRESWREGRKTRKKTIANISHLPKQEIEALRQALRKKDAGAARDDINLSSGKIIGTLHVVAELMKRLGIMDVLGSSRSGALCAWLIFARLVEQGSRLSSVRLAQRHDLNKLGLGDFDENDLYEALDWLGDRQEEIQQKLFKKSYGDKKPQLFLYDVTSSYVEGSENELACWGYNRDKKKGKMQIVFGLLTDEAGKPIAVEIFEGNTSDQKTFVELVKNFAKRFGVEKVTFVGDRGMIKSGGIEELHKNDFFYITAITKPQIKTLMNNEVIQLGLFDNEIQEVEDGGIRYILRRNPQRAVELQDTRMSKFNKLLEKAQDETKYLAEHPKASAKKAKERLESLAKRLHIDSIVTVSVDNKKCLVEAMEDKWKESAELDGCYVLKTDVPSSTADKLVIHQRYKDLAKVERGFRTIKTGLLEVRPIWLRKEKRTRAHVFICMLAYMVSLEINKIVTEDEKIDDILQQLNRIAIIDVEIAGVSVPTIPTPPLEIQSILDRLDITLPDLKPAPIKRRTRKSA